MKTVHPDILRYRFMRREDPSHVVGKEASELWEYLITRGCKGAEFDCTVDRLMELDRESLQ